MIAKAAARYDAGGRPALREEELTKPENHEKLGSDESYAGIGPAWAEDAGRVPPIGAAL